MINAQGISKSFAKVTAVERLSFTAKRGEITGLLGPNGAGKTTTLRMLYGLIKPTEGDVLIDGRSIQTHTYSLQNNIGALPDAGALYTRLTARENITYFARLHGMDKNAIRSKLDELCERFKMHDILDRKTLGFSQGERMKVSLCRALIHDPEFIFLDEPTNGLDVLTTRAVRQLLQDLKAQGKCVVFSSHLMHEVSNLCDQVDIISHGRIVQSGTVEQVVAAASAQSLEDAFVHFAYGPEAKEQNDEVNS